jgi:hypothetical protein
MLYRIGWLRPHIGYVMDHPHPLGSPRRLLKDHQMLALAARAISHAYARLLPRDHVNKIKRRLARKQLLPRPDHKKLIDPQHQMSAGDYAIVQLTYDLLDKRGRHLW